MPRIFITKRERRGHGRTPLSRPLNRLVLAAVVEGHTTFTNWSARPLILPSLFTPFMRTRPRIPQPIMLRSRPEAP